MIEQLQIPGVDWRDHDRSLTLVSYRHGVQEMSEHLSMEALLYSARHAVDYNTSFPYLVQDAKGAIVMTNDELEEALEGVSL